MSAAKKSYIDNLKKDNIHKNILESLDSIEKKDFFDPMFTERLYIDEPVPIKCGQSSDDPVTLARMLNVLSPRKTWRVLEVGTGSGYSTAVLASLVKEVVTIEFHEELAAEAKKNVLKAGFKNVRYFAGDATDFHEPIGEFNGFIVFGACTSTPFSLVNILQNNGAGVFPMGPAHQQQITRYINAVDKDASAKSFNFFDLCAFGSLRGKYGWVDKSESFIVDEAKL